VLDPSTFSPPTLGISYEDAGDGWILARVNEIPQAFSQGRTREEACENALDALRLMLAPDPDTPAQDIDRVELEFRAPR
jgi:predicted RNase H-like HicB family nuclease